jgi:hypothetical protein
VHFGHRTGFRVTPEEKRPDRWRAVRLGGAVSKVIPPPLRELVVVHPFSKHAIEPLADLELPMLDSSPGRSPGRGALVLVPEMVVVANERLQQLTDRKLVDVSALPGRHVFVLYR